MRTNQCVGGWYAFCQVCGGWRGWHAVFADNDEPVKSCLPEGGSVMTTNRASIDKFKSEHNVPGVSLEYYDVGNDPGPCDCIRTDAGLSPSKEEAAAHYGEGTGEQG